VPYAYAFTKQAMAQFQQLDPWLGEEVLDELEKLSASQLSSQYKKPSGAVLDFVRPRDQHVIYVFVSFTAYPNRQLIRVTGLGTYVEMK
jgi:hypothetical protein